MIPKIIHQIFFDIGKGPITNFPLYLKSIDSYKKHNPTWKHKLWSEKEVHGFIKQNYPEIYSFWTEYRYKIQQIDIARYLILHSYGGYYSDLDIICNKPLDSIHRIENELFIMNYKHIKNPTWKMQHAEMDFIGTKPDSDIIIQLVYYAIEQYLEKHKIKAYDNRRFRFIQHTTGPAMFSRFFKTFYPEIKPHNGFIKIFRQEEHEQNSNYILLNYHSNNWIDFKNKKAY